MKWLVVVLWVLAVGCESHAERVRLPVQDTAQRREGVSGDRRAVFRDANRFIRRSEYAAALPLWKSLIGSYPELQDYALHYAALSAARTGSEDAALELWERLAREHPRTIHTAQAGLEQARIWRLRGRIDAARAALAGAARSEAAEVRNEARFEEAEIEIAEGRIREAYGRLRAVREAVPGTALGLRAKVRMSELRKKVADLAPTGEDFEWEARLLLREGDTTAAIAAARSYLGVSNTAKRNEALNLVADAEQAAGHIDQAVSALRQISESNQRTAIGAAALYREARLLWNKDRNEEARRRYVLFLSRFPRDGNAPEAKYALARIDQSSGQTAQAAEGYLRVIRDHKGTPLAREAQWRIAWMRYLQRNWREAAESFASIPSDPGARYWRARSVANAGNASEARSLFESVRQDSPASVYAHWAETRLGSTPERARLQQASHPTTFPEARAADPYHVERARHLHAMGLSAFARAELQAYEDETSRGSMEPHFLASAYKLVNGYRDARRVEKAAGMQDPAGSYPLAYWSLISSEADRHGMDPIMVISLIRQESMFDAEARSSADARGLMQLLPKTAVVAGQRIGREVNVGDLYEPETSIELGVAHLASLLRRYNGDWVRVLAAYNGGEDAVAKWDRQFGSLAIDEWAENITYRETRDYVKKILGNYRKYVQLYGQ